MEVALYVGNAGFSNSFIGHCHRSWQLTASGNVILSHKAGERVCLAGYGAADRHDGAVFFVDVCQTVLGDESLLV